MITKKLLPTNEVFIQFNQEELSKLGLKEGDLLDCNLQEDGSIKLEKYVNLELDISEWPREILELLIKRSTEENISINQIICNILEYHCLRIKK